MKSVSKIQTLGLQNECMHYYNKGLKYGKVAKELNKLVEGDNNISPENVKNFVTRLQRDAILKGEKPLVENPMQILNNIKKIDSKLNKWIEEAEKGILRPVKIGKEIRQVRVMDYYVLNHLIRAVREWSEYQARLAGSLQTGTTINIINIERQYNDFKAVVFDVLKEKPEILKEIENKILKKK